MVHMDHGVGRYLGLDSFDVEGQLTEFLVMEYADGAKLYVLVRHKKDWLLAARHNTFVMEIAIDAQKRELEAVDA